jgi:ATP-dependent Lhr-like helicase
MLTKGQQITWQWYKQKNWEQFTFQQEMGRAYLNGYSGLFNAPTFN